MSYLALAILVAFLATYFLRAVPLLLLRREIRSTWVNSFLYYVPWAVLTAMIVPAAFLSTGTLISALAGVGVALVLAWRGRSLFVVALAAAATVWLVEASLTAVPVLAYC
ncbi:MAG: AzlD domain-containing protein [Mobiluncus porci]|uniref:AzlD domain-containing protein n=1 Tax=Mobiluncus TaxID=2050 RepID=UPI0023F2CF4F|nr:MULTISPECIES: AzlD domain-containing protein [Mobiluncus]MCI6583818.1 AzlD domain-containing protein [Mobiluncus sp.]MDD7541019.1 AzlD domain-containing protein [Mobiluncus porci]MDY5748194.1 AzlD domain-containing protein [Mobiluncus porci]